MALISGPLGFRRYRVTGKPPADLRTDYEKNIRQNSFEPFQESDPREEATGWVCADNLFDTDLSPDRWLDSEAIRLTLRFDRRRVPPSFLKRECEKVQEEWKTRYGREKLTRAEKEQIKETVLKSLLTRALPDTKGVDAYWDMAKEEALFFASGEKPNELFRALFEKTFGVKLSPLFPFAVALAALDEKEKAAAESAPEAFFSARRP